MFCGDGCQGGWGYCTNVSNDGTCGFGVTCLGSQFGDCCSQYMICGSDGMFQILTFLERGEEGEWEIGDIC